MITACVMQSCKHTGMCRSLTSLIKMEMRVHSCEAPLTDGDVVLHVFQEKILMRGKMRFCKQFPQHIFTNSL